MLAGGGRRWTGQARADTIRRMYSLSLAVTTDRTFAADDPLPSELAHRWARAAGTARGLAACSHGPDGEFGVLGTVDGGTGPVPDRLPAAARALTDVLAAAGIRILDWRSIESLAPGETERRLRNHAFPELVDAGRFAELCGVSRSRIHGLASASRRTRAGGRYHPFPPPVVPGYWLRTSAEAFARRRRVVPGPSPRTGTERFLDQVMARRRAARDGLPLPELDYSLLPSTLAESLEHQGYTPDEARAMLERV